jgi:uncharacterized protein YecT (DUF1311 family)
MTRILLAAGLLLGLATPVLAQTQMEVMERTDKELRAADKKLNQVYQQLIKQLDAAGRKDLQAAELAWIKFRDSEVRFSGNRYRGGSIQPTIELSKALELTKQRTAELEAHLQEFNH